MDSVIMGATPKSPAELLKGMAEASPEAIAMQLELFEANYPLLLSRVRSLRQRKGAPNRIDRLVYAAELSRALTYLCDHDYIYFLILTGNFSELSALFAEYFSEEQRAMFNSLEQEYEQIPADQQRPYSSTTTNKQATSTQPIDWDELVTHTSNMELYGLYSMQLKQAKYDYTMTQIQIYSVAGDEQLEHLDQYIAAINADDTMTAEEKAVMIQNANVLRISLMEKREKLEALKAELKGAGINDLEAAEKILLASEDFYEDSKRVTELLGDNQHRSPHIAKLYRKATAVEARVTKDLGVAKEVYEKRVDEIKPNLKVVEKAALDEQLASIIILAKECNLGNSSPEEQERVNNSLIKLEQLKRQLRNTNDHDEIRALLASCTDEMKNLSQTANGGLPKQRLNLGKEIRAFNDYLVRIDENSVLLQTSTQADKTASIERFKKAKAEIQNVKELNEHDLWDVPEEKQPIFETAIQELLMQLSNVREAETIAPDEMAQFERVSHLVGRVKSLGFDKINPVLMSQIFEATNNISVLRDTEDSFQDVLDGVDSYKKNTSSAQF